MILGTYNHLNTEQPFFNQRRFEHSLFLGRETQDTMIRLALDDIYDGEPVVFIDPIGDATETILSHIPEEKQADVIYFNPADADHPFAFNVLAGIQPSERSKLTSTLLLTLRGIWGYEDVATPNIDQHVRAGIGAALQANGTTLVSLKYLLTDEAYRKKLLCSGKNPVLQSFWDDFEVKDERSRQKDIESTLNKLWAFMLEPMVNNCINQANNHLSFKNRIVLVNLPQDQLGIDNSSLLGALVLARLFIDRSVKTHLYVHECNNFATTILLHSLRTSKKTSVQLSLQHLDLLSPKFQNSIISTVGTIVSSKTGVSDAQKLQNAFNLPPGFSQLYELTPGAAYAAIDGMAEGIELYGHGYPLTGKVRRKIIDRCRSQYCAPREDAEKRMDRFLCTSTSPTKSSGKRGGTARTNTRA